MYFKKIGVYFSVKNQLFNILKDPFKKKKQIWLSRGELSSTKKHKRKTGNKHKNIKLLPLLQNTYPHRHHLQH